jgi:hypothetical protein
MATGRQALSADNPWPGLDSFEETDRAFFFGRTAESSELLRLVNREPLTVLFGRSGLGKTSLLRAGLFPLLRAQSCLPVYVRFDHSDHAPPLRDQVFHTLRAACEAEGIQASSPRPGDGCWAFFRRRDTEFWTVNHRPVVPVLVLDQFEEIFTLGRQTDAADARSSAFLTELSELVENRPPAAVRTALEADPAAARRYEFKRSTVRLILSFREDFLADVEQLKVAVPSLMYNRFRLLAMNGHQAYEVIVRAGSQVVDDDVGRRILGLAWTNEDRPVDTSEFSAVEVDPALLSVVASELNRKRQHAIPPSERITPALLEGADREILSGFYEASMAGLDPRVRTFVEDELITGRGYRDSHVLEDALTRPGVTADAIDALIHRRLLRVDERQHTHRVELTHDVLTRVVRESRDNRRAREAEEAARAREREALARQRRNRRNAVLVGVAALIVAGLMVLAGVFAWRALATQRRADKLLAEAEALKLMARADEVQNASFDLSLLLTVEAMRSAPLGVSPWQTNPLVRRFDSHPHLLAFLNHDADVVSVALGREGALVASGDVDGTITLWDTKTRARRATWKAHTDSITSVAFSPDGRRLGSGSADKTVALSDVDAGRRLTTSPAQSAGVTDVVFSSDGKRLAWASGDGTLVAWDVDADARIGTVTANVLSLAFTPDGRQVVGARSDGGLAFWDPARGTMTVGPLARDQFMAAAFSQDGRRVAWGNSRGVVPVWDVLRRHSFWTLDTHDTLLDNSVAISGSGEFVTTALYGGDILLWELRGLSRVATLEGHRGGIARSVAFGPETQATQVTLTGTDKRALIASASHEPQVILWSTIPVWGGQYEAATPNDACRTVNRNLMCNEWNMHIGTNKPYHKTCPELPGPEKCW